MRASLRWERGPGAEACLDEAGLRLAVAARLGRHPFVEGGPGEGGDADAHLEGRIERRRGAWRVALVLRAADGRALGARELRSERRSCAGVSEAVALMTALLLDVDRGAVALTLPVDPVGPREPPAQTAAGAASSGPDGEAASPAERGAALPFELSSTVGAIAAVEVVPGVGFGARAGVAARFANLIAVEVEGVWLGEEARGLTTGADVAARGAEGSGAVVRVAFAALSLCLDADAPPFRLGGCASVSAGERAARAFGFDLVREAAVPWVAVGLSLRARAFLDDVFVELAATPLVPLARDAFRANVDGGLVTLHEPPLVAGTLTLSAGLRAAWGPR